MAARGGHWSKGGFVKGGGGGGATLSGITFAGATERQQAYADDLARKFEDGLDDFSTATPQGMALRRAAQKSAAYERVKAQNPLPNTPRWDDQSAHAAVETKRADALRRIMKRAQPRMRSAVLRDARSRLSKMTPSQAIDALKSGMGYGMGDYLGFAGTAIGGR